VSAPAHPQRPLQPRLAGAVVAVMAFESLLVASPVALGAAALFAAVDVLGARSPYALAAAWLAPAAPPRVPGGPGRVAAIARAVVLAGATALLVRDATVASAVLAGIVVTEGLLAAILGRSPLGGRPFVQRRRD
jgi:hypothetical protein